MIDRTEKRRAKTINGMETKRKWYSEVYMRGPALLDGVLPIFR